MTDSPVYCAIDRPDRDGALSLARALAGSVRGVKLGLEFFIASGPGGVSDIGATGTDIFLDLKLHDIPNTVAGAVRSVCALDVAMLTVHAAGGPAMLVAAAKAARDAERRPLLLGVTVLTSFDNADLAATGIAGMTSDQALRLADLCIRSGIDGIVCSAHEIASMRERFGRDVLLVTPGIRPAGSSFGDQKRVMTPAEALDLGADILVIGRPITDAADPAEAARHIHADLAGAL